MEIKKRVTKLRLADIPKVGSPFRTAVIKQLTELDIYKEEIKKNAAMGFTTEELKAIGEKYKHQRGLFNEDIQNEINKKGWLIKPSTIKQYIQKGQLPMSKERRRIKGGAVSLYPLDFMHHLNFVRFLLNAGRETCEKILNVFTTPPVSHRMSDYSFLQSIYYEEEIYDGDDRLESFLYQPAEHFSLGLIEAFIVDELDPKIALIEFAKTVLVVDKPELHPNSYDIKLLKAIKSKLEFSKKVDNEFYNRVETRLQKYLQQLQKIRQTLEGVSRSFDSLIEETKKASWT